MIIKCISICIQCTYRPWAWDGRGALSTQFAAVCGRHEPGTRVAQSPRGGTQTMGSRRSIARKVLNVASVSLLGISAVLVVGRFALSLHRWDAIWVAAAL